MVALPDTAIELGVIADKPISVTRQQTAKKVWVLGMVAYLALAIGTAMSRQPYSDEGELASPAYNLVHRGHMEVTQWEDARDSDKAYWMPPVFFFFQAAWQALVGFGVIQFRLGTVLWGLILLFAVRYIVKALTGDAVLAALTGVALGLDYTYLMHAGIGRCEIMSASLAIVSTAVYLRLRDQSVGMAVFTSHALMTCSGLTHPVGGMVWMPCLIGIQMWLDRPRLRWKHYAVAVIPYLIGGAAWGTYILQDPAEFNRQFVDSSLGMGRLSAVHDPFGAFKRELARFFGYYGIRPDASLAVRVKAILPVGYLLGLAGALLIGDARKRRFVRAGLLLFAVQFLILTLAEGTKQYHYIVHVVPTLVAILVAVLWSLWETQPGQRRIWAVAAFMLLVIQIGPVLFRIGENRYFKDFLPTVEAARPFVQQGLRVMSGAEFAIPFGFPENIVTRWDLGYDRPALPDVVITSVEQFERTKVFSRTDPGFHHYLTVIFPATFELVFRQGDFAIYKRRMK